jgi:hypothetical protein
VYVQGGGLLLTLMPAQINADGLVAVVEKKAQGEAVAPEEVIDIQVRPYVPRVSSRVSFVYRPRCVVLILLQREVERQKQAQRAQKDVQRVLQQATDSENKLDVALKVRLAYSDHNLDVPTVTSLTSVVACMCPCLD